MDMLIADYKLQRNNTINADIIDTGNNVWTNTLNNKHKAQYKYTCYEIHIIQSIDIIKIGLDKQSIASSAYQIQQITEQLNP